MSRQKKAAGIWKRLLRGEKVKPVDVDYFREVYKQCTNSIMRVG